ncbi:MAG TPA: hypothetical protein VGR37_14350 [Longimicrobiaceae bacterium]|nr:hypothetical protein [Longimicrobiaceae bacterium]
MRRNRFKLLALTLSAASVLAACAEDDATPIAPVAPSVGGELFTRYVSLGQSNTAGLMSAGINDSTQHLPYPVLLARKAGAGERFFVPSLEMPGCPPPLLGPQPLTSQRVGGGTATTCALRAPENLPFVSNLAVPSSRIVDWVNNGLPDTRSNALTTLILGGRTQLQAMRDANPTFVSVWPEGNDVLGAAAAGVPAAATSQAAFEAALDQIVAGIKAEGAQALFMSVLNVPLVAPALQPGAYYFALQAAGQSPKPVSPNCAPGTPGGSSLVSFGLLTDPSVAVISCNATDPGVLSPAEIGDVTARVNAYNAALKARADANGWAYLDVNAVAMTQVLNDPNKLRKCQGLATATLATFAQAVAATCPGPTAPNFWGSFMSFDPIHFNAQLHQLIANEAARAINGKFGTTLPTS